MLTALAARYLLSPGLVTASILGYGGTTYAPLLLIARHVPQVSHVSVYAGAERTGPPDPRVIDELELAGIALSAAGSRDDAVFGASLVVITDPAGVAGPPMHPAKGAVLVNATGRDLPEEVVGRVGHVFVDDLALLSPAARHGPARPARIATHRLPRCQPAGDLRQLVTGEHPGRSSPEQTFLVELLSVNPPTTAADGARTDRPDGT